MYNKKIELVRQVLRLAHEVTARGGGKTRFVCYSQHGKHNALLCEDVGKEKSHTFKAVV